MISRDSFKSVRSNKEEQKEEDFRIDKDVDEDDQGGRDLNTDIPNDRSSQETPFQPLPYDDQILAKYSQESEMTIRWLEKDDY